MTNAIPSAYESFWHNFNWDLYVRIIQAKFVKENEDLQELINNQKETINQQQNDNKGN